MTQNAGPVVLGKEYKDSITGFLGVATSKTEFLHGCVRVGIQPKELREGKPVESQVFDEQQLIDVAAEKPVQSASPAGGPGDPLPRRTVPTR